MGPEPGFILEKRVLDPTVIPLAIRSSFFLSSADWSMPGGLDLSQIPAKRAEALIDPTTFLRCSS